MAGAGDRRVTYEDILALPEHVTGEIIGGALYTSPGPAGPHVFVASELRAELRRGRGGGLGEWFILFKPELHFGDEILVPDIAGWRRERLPLEARKGAFFTIAPDWVCEVQSPSTSRRDRMIKAPCYAAHGVDHLWLVNPREGLVEAFARREDQWLWLGSWSGEDAKIPPFDAVSLDLAAIWALIGGPEGSDSER